jgi:hypothetical protein
LKLREEKSERMNFPKNNQIHFSESLFFCSNTLPGANSLLIELESYSYSLAERRRSNGCCLKQIQLGGNSRYEKAFGTAFLKKIHSRKKNQV